jgi:hypothetical protein
MTDEHGHADTHGLQGQAGEAEDLAGLRPQLGLLVELVPLERPIHRQVGLRRLDGAEPLDPGVARA